MDANLQPLAIIEEEFPDDRSAILVSQKIAQDRMCEVRTGGNLVSFAWGRGATQRVQRKITE
jgi:hypothetical protein